jgi:hypothetical protein
MSEMKEAGAFAASWSSGGHDYGLQRSLILAALKMNKVPVIKLPASALQQLQQNWAPAALLSAFLAPPPPAELALRLQKSGQQLSEEEQVDDAHVQAACDHVIPSQHLEHAFLQIEKLALAAAGAKTVEHFTAEDEKRIVLMQTIARGKRDKKRVDSLRQQRRVSAALRPSPCLLPPPPCCQVALMLLQATLDADAAATEAPPAASGDS